jgi:hypothetical protein
MPEPAPAQSPSPKAAYKRVLLKLSGEALMGPEGYGISPQVLGQIADEIVSTTRSRSSSGAVTSFAAYRNLRAAWTARPQTTSACWPP